MSRFFSAISAAQVGLALLVFSAISASLVGMVLFGSSVSAQDGSPADGIDVSRVQMTAACIPVEQLKTVLERMGFKNVKMKPILIDDKQDGWILVEDADGHRPTLLLLVLHEPQRACLIAASAPDQV